MQKLEFTAVGYGDSSDIEVVLRPMADELNGKLKMTIEPSKLEEAF